LREKVVKTSHDSCIGGQVGIQSSYKRFKAMCLLAFDEKNDETASEAV